MITKITSENNRYGFVILGDRRDEIFVSKKSYFLVPFLKSSYQYAWEAQRDARKLLNKHSYHIKCSMEDMTAPIITDISAEEMLENHYYKILRSLRSKAKGAVGDKEEGEKVYKELKMIIGELKSIRTNLTEIEGKTKIGKILAKFKSLMHRYFKAKEEKDALDPAPQPMQQPMQQPVQPPVMASKKDINQFNTEGFLDGFLKKELLEDYAERICEAIEEHHINAVYDVEPSLKNIVISEVKGDTKKPILNITINKHLMVNSIVSVGDLYKIFPHHSCNFYQRYWKPIVEGLGHFFIDDFSLLISPSKANLPDIPYQNKDYKLKGWNETDKRSDVVDISFKQGSDKNSIWFFDKHASKRFASNDGVSKYTEKDYLNSVVKCIDPQLQSIYGRSGTVIEIIPHSDLIEVDVNFGRGLGVVRLTEDKIEIVVK